MSILVEIQNDLVNDSAALTNTLRKSKILAARLNFPEFREWVDAELGGYSDTEQLPQYRRFPATSRGTYMGPFGHSLRGQIVPTYGLTGTVKDFAENLLVHHGVGELEDMLNSGTETFQILWPHEYVALSQEATRFNDETFLFSAYKVIPRGLLAGVLENIKNKLLDFALALGEHQVDGSNPLDQSTQAEARNIFHVTIYGDHNTVATGENVQQTTSQVQQGDVTSLLDYFRQIGVSEADLGDLETAVASEPTATSEEFGPAIRAWIGKMALRAGTEFWKVATGSAVGLLQQGLRHFYGL